MGTGLALAGPLNYAALARRSRHPLATEGAFQQGVASGFPWPNAITLWTRLGGVERDVHVDLEVATDHGFHNVIRRHKVKLLARGDHTGRAHIKGLEPHHEYFYRFSTKHRSSEIGRLRTGLPEDSKQPVRIAYFSCQNYEAGFYNAQRAIANEPDLDLVLCLGDYIYESGGDPTGVRHDRTGINKDGDVQTLAEYRQKYHLYKGDRDLRAMHAAHPYLGIWDDHEVEDNYADGKPSSHAQPGQTNDGHPRRVPFLKRRANGYRAFYENMPRTQYLGHHHRIYEQYRLGSLVDLLLTDERRYRDRQPCNDSIIVPCAEENDPNRTMLGAGQKAWFKKALRKSRQRWKLWANEVMVMSLQATHNGSGVIQDQWDGYAHERAELMSYVLEHDIEGLNILTGDIHTFFAGTASTTGDDRGRPTAPEFPGGSATSHGFAEETGLPVSTLEALAPQDPHIAFFDFVNHGYALVEASRHQLTCEYKAVDSKHPHRPRTTTLAEWSVKPGQRSPTRIS